MDAVFRRTQSVVMLASGTFGASRKTLALRAARHAARRWHVAFLMVRTTIRLRKMLNKAVRLTLAEKNYVQEFYRRHMNSDGAIVGVRGTCLAVHKLTPTALTEDQIGNWFALWVPPSTRRSDCIR